LDRLYAVFFYIIFAVLYNTTYCRQYFGCYTSTITCLQSWGQNFDLLSIEVVITPRVVSFPKFFVICPYFRETLCDD